MMEIVHQLCKVTASARRRLTPHAINVQGRKGRFRAAFLWVKECRKCLENSDRNSLRVKYFARGRSDVANLLTVRATWSSRSNSMHFRKNMKATRNGQNPEVTSVGVITYPVRKGENQKAVTKGAASVGILFLFQCRSALAKRGAACTEVHMARSPNRKVAIRPSRDAQQSIYHPARSQEKDRNEGDSRKVCPHSLAIIVLALWDFHSWKSYYIVRHAMMRRLQSITPVADGNGRASPQVTQTRANKKL